MGISCKNNFTCVKNLVFISKIADNTVKLCAEFVK